MPDEPLAGASFARLERVVCENRFTIAVVFPAVGALTLVASSAGLLPPLLAYNPLLVLFGTLVMRLPLVAALGPLVDRRAAALLAVLVAYTYAIEAVGLLIVVDLVLDPAAVSIEFWTYDGGPYYGVPVSNYLGWLLSGSVAVGLIDAAFDRHALLARLDACPFALDDMVSFTLLWGVINVSAGNWLPVGFALLLVAGLARTERFDLATPRLQGFGWG